MCLLGVAGLGLAWLSTVDERSPSTDLARPAPHDSSPLAAVDEFGAIPLASPKAPLTVSSGNFAPLGPAPELDALAASMAIRSAAQPGAAFLADNPDHGFRSRFLTGGGVHLMPLDERLAWNGTMRHGQQSATPHRIDEHRIEFAHSSGLREWYENSTRGLEHGFVVSAKAAETLRDHPDNRLVVPMKLEGLSAEADPASPGDLRLVDANGQAVLGYRGLKIWDANGTTLEGEMQPTENGFLLAVHDTDATFPITIDPFIVSFDNDVLAGQHESIAVSGDFIATGYQNTNSDDRGEFRIFQYDGSSLNEELYAFWPNAEIPSVAIDGATAAVGYREPLVQEKVVIFRRFENVGVSWVVEHEITLTDEPEELALDGDTLMIDDGSSTAVWKRIVSTWALEDTIPTTGPIQLEGDTAVIGNEVYVRSGSTWSQQQALTEVPAPGWVALSGDTAILDTTPFVRSGPTWTSQPALPVTAGPVALEGDRALFLSVVAGSGIVITPFERVGATWNALTPFIVPRYCSRPANCFNPRADLATYRLYLEGDRATITGFWQDFSHWRGVTFLTLTGAGISVPPVEVDESAGTAEVVVHLPEPAASQITIEYATMNGTAEAGTDYTAQTGTLTIPIGESSGTIPIPILDDNWHEATETFQVTFSNATGLTLPDPIQTTVTIMDDDTLEISVLDASATEGEQLNVTVELTTPSTFPVSFRLWYYDNTEFINDTFEPGETSITLDLGTVPQDALVEGTQTFSMELQDVTVAAIGDGTGVITIIDDDLTSLFIADLTVNEWEGAISILVEVPQGLANEIEISLETTDGSAAEGSDFLAPSGTVMLPSSALSTPILIPIIDDFLVEGTESFTITASAPTGESATATITIIDGGPGFDGWAIDQGFGDTQTGPDNDLNNDGFDNMLHQGLAMPLDAFIPTERPSLIPEVDLETVPGRATYFVEVPVPAVADVVLGVEESFDGEVWTELANRDDSGTWSWDPRVFLILGATADGYQRIGVVGLGARNPTALVRLTARPPDP